MVAGTQEIRVAVQIRDHLCRRLTRQSSRITVPNSECEWRHRENAAVAKGRCLAMTHQTACNVVSQLRAVAQQCPRCARRRPRCGPAPAAVPGFGVRSKRRVVGDVASVWFEPESFSFAGSCRPNWGPRIYRASARSAQWTPGHRASDTVDASRRGRSASPSPTRDVATMHALRAPARQCTGTVDKQSRTAEHTHPVTLPPRCALPV